MSTKYVEKKDFELEIEKGAAIITEIYSKFSIPFIIEQSCRKSKPLDIELKLAEKRISKLEKALSHVVGLSRILVSEYKKTFQSKKSLNFSQNETLPSPIRDDYEEYSEDIEENEEEYEEEDQSEKEDNEEESESNESSGSRSTLFKENEKLKEMMNEVQNQLEKEKEINEIKDINILKLEEEIELQKNDKARLEKNIEEISEKFDAEKLNAEKFLQKFEAEKENVQVLIMKIEALEQHLKKDIKGDNDSVNEIDVKVKLEDEGIEKNVKLELLEDEKVVQESSQLIIDELREEIRFLTEQLDAETKTNEMSINKIQELELEIQEINWKYHQFTDEPLEFQLENEKFKIISLQETIESLNLDLETSEKIQSELTSKIMDLECNSSLAQESQLYLQNSELNETIEKLKEELESLYEIQKSLDSKNSELEARLKENEEETDELYLSVQENNEKIDSLNKKISSFKSKISSLQSKTKADELDTERSDHSSTKRKLESLEESKSSSNNNNNGYASYSRRCQATTQRGTQCKRNSQSGRSYCWQH